jgi:hypothetical protein
LIKQRWGWEYEQEQTEFGVCIQQSKPKKTADEQTDWSYSGSSRILVGHHFHQGVEGMGMDQVSALIDPNIGCFSIYIMYT